MELQDTTVSTTYGDVSIPSESTGETPSAGSTSPSPDQGNENQSTGPWWETEQREVEFAAAGKRVKAPLAKTLQWAQQGYDYAQRMQAFNQERQTWESQKAELAKDQEWSEVVKFARDNPEWANFTRQQWEQRQNWQSQAQQNPEFQPFLDEIQNLKNELATLKSPVQEFQQEQTRLRQESEDKALELAVKDVQEKYSRYGMDLSQIDPETGLSYERSVLKHGYENGIKSFKAAFLDRYGDKLEAMREEALKKQAVEETAKRAREGFIGRSPTPQAKQQLDYRNMSYSQLASKAHEIYGSGKK